MEHHLIFSFLEQTIKSMLSLYHSSYYSSSIHIMKLNNTEWFLTNKYCGFHSEYLADQLMTSTLLTLPLRFLIIIPSINALKRGMKCHHIVVHAVCSHVKTQPSLRSKHCHGRSRFFAWKFFAPEPHYSKTLATQAKFNLIGIC